MLFGIEIGDGVAFIYFAKAGRSASIEKERFREGGLAGTGVTN